MADLDQESSLGRRNLETRMTTPMLDGAAVLRLLDEHHGVVEMQRADSRGILVGPEAPSSEWYALMLSTNDLARSMNVPRRRYPPP